MMPTALSLVQLLNQTVAHLVVYTLLLDAYLKIALSATDKLKLALLMKHLNSLPADAAPHAMSIVLQYALLLVPPPISVSEAEPQTTELEFAYLPDSTDSASEQPRPSEPQLEANSPPLSFVQ